MSVMSDKIKCAYITPYDDPNKGTTMGWDAAINYLEEMDRYESVYFETRWLSKEEFDEIDEQYRW